MGGKDIDQKIINWIADEFKKDSGVDIKNDNLALQRLDEAAEKAKIELSSTTETEINLPFLTADASGEISIHQDADGTLVHFHIQYELKFGPLGRLMDALMVRPQFAKVIPNVLLGLKHYAETGETVTPQVIKRIRTQLPQYA